MKSNILNVHTALLEKYGNQNWWPVLKTNASEREMAFEISIGAILTQNTSWKNVEKAINNLIEKNLLSPELILKAPLPKIAECIKLAGYYNQKAERLRIFSEFFLKEFDDLKSSGIKEARQKLLNVKGIGPETADSILLYALSKPVFVIDAYTKRLFSRLFNLNFKSYDEWQNFFHKNLEKDVNMFNEFHALIVEHCKNICKKEPLCEKCLIDLCFYGKKTNS